MQRTSFFVRKSGVKRRLDFSETSSIHTPGAVPENDIFVQHQHQPNFVHPDDRKTRNTYGPFVDLVCRLCNKDYVYSVNEKYKGSLLYHYCNSCHWYRYCKNNPVFTQDNIKVPVRYMPEFQRCLEYPIIDGIKYRCVAPKSLKTLCQNALFLAKDPVIPQWPKHMLNQLGLN